MQSVTKTLAGMIRAHGLARVDAVFTERAVMLKAIPHPLHPIIDERRVAGMSALVEGGKKKPDHEDVSEIMSVAMSAPLQVVSHPDLDAAVSILGRALKEMQ